MTTKKIEISSFIRLGKVNVEVHANHNLAVLTEDEARELMHALSDALNKDDVHVDIEESFSHTFIGCPEQYEADH